MSESQVRYRQNPAVIANSLDGVQILLHSETGVLANLNESGMEVWRLCAQPVGLSEITEQMEEMFEVDSELLARDVREAVDDLLKMDLLVVDGP